MHLKRLVKSRSDGWDPSVRKHYHVVVQHKTNLIKQNYVDTAEPVQNTDTLRPFIK